MACHKNTDEDMERHESDKMHVTSLRNYLILQLQDVSCGSFQQKQTLMGNLGCHSRLTRESEADREGR